MLITDIESELSYAYLHAVAGRAGMSCGASTRHDDNAGVDTMINYRGKTDHPYVTDVQLNIQLKATIANPGSNPDFVQYTFKGIDRYNKLRSKTGEIYKILVVLYLPENKDLWLRCTTDELILKDSAFWTCLYGAEASANSTSTTLYLPRAHRLTPEGLLLLANLAAIKKVPLYQRP